MIPEQEFTDEISAYIDSFIKAGRVKGETTDKDQAKLCATLITKLARVTEFQSSQ